MDYVELLLMAAVYLIWFLVGASGPLRGWVKRLQLGSSELSSRTWNHLVRQAEALGLAVAGERGGSRLTVLGTYRDYSVSLEVQRVPSPSPDRDPPLKVQIEVTPRALHLAEEPSADDDGSTFSWRLWRRELVVVYPVTVRRLLDDAVATVAGLDAAATAPWLDVARQRGLRPFALTRSGLPSMAGTIGGVQVDVVARGMRPDVVWRVSAVPNRPVVGLVLRWRDDGFTGDRTGNPVLDRVVYVALPPGTAAETLAPWLADADRAGAILGALGDHPRSTVRDGVVTLVAPVTDPAAFDALVEEAVMLASVLDAPGGTAASV